jgi:hypothetical protein
MEKSQSSKSENSTIARGAGGMEYIEMSETSEWTKGKVRTYRRNNGRKANTKEKKEVEKENVVQLVGKNNLDATKRRRKRALSNFSFLFFFFF